MTETDKIAAEQHAAVQKLVTRLTAPPETAWEYVVRAFQLGLTLLLFAIMWRSVAEGGWSKMLDSLWLWGILLVLTATLSSVADNLRTHPFAVMTGLLLTVGGVVLVTTGGLGSWRQILWDLAGIGIGLLLSACFVATYSLYTIRRRGVKAPALRESANGFIISLHLFCFAIFAWIGVSFITAARAPLPTPNPDRFEEIAATSILTRSVERPVDEIRVGLALSGGGYRAAVYHAGVLHELENLGIRLDSLSTVSGGSIIGAYYAIGGDPVDFKDAVAQGRFNLKRELALFQNLIRIGCPLTVPFFDVKLLPNCDYSRLDVQASMLDRLLYDGKTHDDPAKESMPHLMINATDLTYAMLVSMMPDGIMAESTKRDTEAYRNSAYRPQERFSLAEKVAISGAFPIAFPATDLFVSVDSQQGSGTGTRHLMLVDGGVADNTGLHALVSAKQLACSTEPCSDSHDMAAHWNNDILLVSNAGAIFGVEKELATPAQLSRAVDIGAAHGGIRDDKIEVQPAVHFSAQDAFRDPGLQFRLYDDPNDRSHGMRARYKRVRFFPTANSDAAILERIVALLPEEIRVFSQHALRDFLRATNGIQPPEQRVWLRYLIGPEMDERDSCERLRESGPDADALQSLPGICAAAELRRYVRQGSSELHESFRNTSTLDDQFGPDRTDALFRLGQLKVLLEIDCLKNAIAAHYDNVPMRRYCSER